MFLLPVLHPTLLQPYYREENIPYKYSEKYFLKFTLGFKFSTFQNTNIKII